MSSFKQIDIRRDEFRKYLERTGAMEATSKAFIKLFECQDRPENAIKFLRENLGDALKDVEAIDYLKRELEDSRHEINKLKRDLESIKIEKEKLLSAAATAIPTPAPASTAAAPAANAKSETVSDNIAKTIEAANKITVEKIAIKEEVKNSETLCDSSSSLSTSSPENSDNKQTVATSAPETEETQITNNPAPAQDDVVSTTTAADVATDPPNDEQQPQKNSDDTTAAAEKTSVNESEPKEQ